MLYPPPPPQPPPFQRSRSVTLERPFNHEINKSSLLNMSNLSYSLDEYTVFFLLKNMQFFMTDICKFLQQCSFCCGPAIDLEIVYLLCGQKICGAKQEIATKSCISPPQKKCVPTQTTAYPPKIAVTHNTTSQTINPQRVEHLGSVQISGKSSCLKVRKHVVEKWEFCPLLPY